MCGNKGEEKNVKKHYKKSIVQLAKKMCSYELQCTNAEACEWATDFVCKLMTACGVNGKMNERAEVQFLCLPAD